MDRGVVTRTETIHFHMDLFGNYIPGLCSGLAIRREDLGSPLKESSYPLLHRLVTGGIRGLYQWAQDRHDFQPGRTNYINKCDLCTEIRTHLAQNSDETFAELMPLEFYQ